MNLIILLKTKKQMPKPNKNQIMIGVFIVAVIALAYFNNFIKSNGQITQASASEVVCTIDQYKDCTIDQLNGLVTNLNTQVDGQNQLITSLQANLAKAQTNKTNLESQKSLIISARDAKLKK
jgi:hypothetical protein